MDCSTIKFRQVHYLNLIWLGWKKNGVISAQQKKISLSKIKPGDLCCLGLIIVEVPED